MSTAIDTEALQQSKRMRKLVSVAAGMAGLLFGLDIGVIAGALPFITDQLSLTSQMQEWIVSSMMFGAAIGSIITLWISSKLGRKKSIFISFSYLLLVVLVLHSLLIMKFY